MANPFSASPHANPIGLASQHGTPIRGAGVQDRLPSQLFSARPVTAPIASNNLGTSSQRPRRSLHEKSTNAVNSGVGFVAAGQSFFSNGGDQRSGTSSASMSNTLGRERPSHKGHKPSSSGMTRSRSHETYGSTGGTEHRFTGERSNPPGFGSSKCLKIKIIA